MPRQFPDELHIGQKVFVHLHPTAHPVEALVTYIDAIKGLIHVNPIGYKVRWAAHPRAISSLRGLYLHFENEQFFFSSKPSFA